MSTKYDPHFKQEAINLALSSDQTYRQIVLLQTSPDEVIKAFYQSNLLLKTS